MPKRGACPEAELIAAHAERRLVGDEATRMDEHLASCPTCPEVFAETLRFIDEQELGPAPARAVAAPEPDDAGASPRAPMHVGARPPIHRQNGFRLAATLAAAATVIMALQLWRRSANPPEREIRVADAPEVGTERPSKPIMPRAERAEPEVHTPTPAEQKRRSGRSASPTSPGVVGSPSPVRSENTVDLPAPAKADEPEVLPSQAEAISGVGTHPAEKLVPPARAPEEVATPVLAQTPKPTPSPKPQDELVKRQEIVVVSASKIETQLVNAPATMSVIPAEMIETSPAQNYGDILRSVPGLNVIQVSVRDFNLTARQATSTLASSTLVAVDGRSVYLDFFGFVLWDFVPSPASGEIERIEVVRGPASVMWGANAVNGLVNFITKNPREREGFGFVLGAGLFDRHGGSREAAGNGYQLNGGFSFADATSDTWSYKVNAGYYYSDPFSRPVGTVPLHCHPLGVVPCRDATLRPVPGGLPIGGATYPADVKEPGGFENAGTSQPKLDLRVDQELSNGGRITYLGGYGGTEGIIHTGIGPFQLKSGSFMGYGRVVYKRGALQVAASANLLDAHASNLLQADPDTLRPIQLDVKTQTYDVEFGNSNVLGGKHILTYGGNYRRNAFDVSLAKGPDRDEFGAYGHWEYFVDKFRLAAGVRTDKSGNLEKWVWSPRVSVMSKPTPGQSIRASYNRAFVSPSFINNYLDQNLQGQTPVDLTPLAAALPPPLAKLVPPPFLLTVNAFGNRDLREQSTEAFEIAYNGTLGHTTIALAAYLSNTDDNINFTSLLPPGPGYPSPTYYSPENPARGVTVPTPTAPAAPITLSPALMQVLANLPPQLGGPILLPEKVATYLNLAPIRNRGVEASIDHRLNRTVSFFANYSWQDTPEILRASSDKTPFPANQLGIPAKHRFNVGLGYNGPLLFGNANVNYASKALWVDVLTSGYAGFTDAYSMLNAAVGVKLGNGKVIVSLRGTNLANERIQQHIFGDILKRSLVFEVRLPTR